ncbi:MAG: hypothetical protein M1838_003825 [Thelocarpon superellum]|nr:MAG: hypothetical protein M1838_003825 [Thelocarpon superellum]
MDRNFFAGFKRDLHREVLWRDFYPRAVTTHPGVPEISIPAMPDIDAEWLFWEMMRVSQTPDQWMYPALKRLRASKRFLLGALSNAYIFPPGHPYNERKPDDVRDVFHVFISSAHVGLRKPDPKIYHLAVGELDQYARNHAQQSNPDLGWADGVTPQDVVFLDDIGANLKTAKQVGMRTIRVHLGKGLDAVKELEKITDLGLVEDNHNSKL